MARVLEWQSEQPKKKSTWMLESVENNIMQAPIYGEVFLLLQLNPFAICEKYYPKLHTSLK